jgi:hypothetical protein
MSHGHDDFAFEPIRGIPAALPRGESLLWQGEPDWKALAIGAFHVRKVALYFTALLAWRIGVGVAEAHAAHAILVSCLWIGGLGATATAVLTGLAYASARCAVYSITSERIILRHGVAVSMTMNVPFTLLESAALKRRSPRDGDIAIRLRKDQRVGYLVTWPYVRPWHFARPEVSFRALPDAEQAADVLAKAMLAHAGANGERVEVGATTDVPARVGSQTAAAA